MYLDIFRDSYSEGLEIRVAEKLSFLGRAVSVEKFCIPLLGVNRTYSVFYLVCQADWLLPQE